MRKLSKKTIENRLKYVPAMIDCGLHSGFPVCCVQYYVSVWIWIDQAQMDEYRKEIRAITGDGVGYIPCPDCLVEKSFIAEKEIILCNCWHGNAWLIFED